MQLKIPFGSSWELLRVALPEWWEYSIPAPRAGVSVCSEKREQPLQGRGSLASWAHCGPTDEEVVSPSLWLASRGRKGAQLLHPSSWRSVTPAPRPGCGRKG